MPYCCYWGDTIVRFWSMICALLLCYWGDTIVRFWEHDLCFIVMLLG